MHQFSPVGAYFRMGTYTREVVLRSEYGYLLSPVYSIITSNDLMLTIFMLTIILYLYMYCTVVYIIILYNIHTSSKLVE